MKKTARKFLKLSLANLSAVALSLIVGLGTPSGVRADQAYAKSQLKAMSDYMATQKTVSFAYDATLEVVTTDNQKLALASSGTIRMRRPDKIRITARPGLPISRSYLTGKYSPCLTRMQISLRRLMCLAPSTTWSTSCGINTTGPSTAQTC